MKYLSLVMLFALSASTLVADPIGKIWVDASSRQQHVWCMLLLEGRLSASIHGTPDQQLRAMKFMERMHVGDTFDSVMTVLTEGMKDFYSETQNIDIPLDEAFDVVWTSLRPMTGRISQ